MVMPVFRDSLSSRGCEYVVHPVSNIDHVYLRCNITSPPSASLGPRYAEAILDRLDESVEFGLPDIDARKAQQLPGEVLGS